MRISDWSSDVCSSDLWCDGTRTPHLHFYAQQPSGFFLCGKLVRNGKARRASNIAKHFLRFQRIAFVDHAINVKRQCRACTADMLVEIQQTLCAADQFARLVHRQAQDLQPSEPSCLGLWRHLDET